MFASDEIHHHITTILDRWFGVDTLWLYGSLAEGTTRADSDVVLAVLFRRRPQGLEIFDARQVLKHGRLLVDRNPSRRHDAFSRIVSLYEDVKILRRESERALFQRMKVGRA